jgi:hypothetical protein
VALPVAGPDVVVPDVVEPEPEPVPLPPVPLVPLVPPDVPADVELPVPLPVGPDVVTPPSRALSELKTSPPHPKKTASARTSKEVLDFMGLFLVGEVRKRSTGRDSGA